MRKATIDPNRQCPKCRTAEHQVNIGYNRSGTRRCQCRICGMRYTPEPKKHEYPDEIKQQALRMYRSGASGRAIGKALGMNKANVYHWLRTEKKGAGGK